MRNFLSLVALAFSLSAFAQTPPFVSLNDIQFVSAADLASCNDTSQYHGDTIRTVGVVVVDGGLVEVSSGSVQGGFRPFMYIADTATGTTAQPFKAIEVLCSYSTGTNLVAHPTASQVIAGDIVEVIGVVDMFARNNQVEIIDLNSITLLTGAQAAPQAAVVNLGDLNDNNRVNQLETGEQWEGAFVEIQNVTVVSVSLFAGGNRVSFDVADANGNLINVSDRFIAQKMSNHTPVNPESPFSIANGGPGAGQFTAPTVGAFFNSIRGIVIHSANGCTGGNGRGYELNPFDSSHYDLGASPPFIENVTRLPLVPSSTQTVEVNFTAYDLDGTVDVLELYYSNDSTAPLSSFSNVTPQLIPGTADEYSAIIPAHPNGTFVRYYIEAIDNDSNVTQSPFGASDAYANIHFYTVRDDGMVIPDIQTSLDFGASPYVNQQVTVTGVVSASTRTCDLGFVYIQDPSFTEWAGIALLGSSDLATLYRDEEITVTGTVEENFGFTQMNVSNVTKTGNRETVQAVAINPNMPAMYASGEVEKYESMLVRAENPAGDVVISNPRSGNFGDYLISTDTANGSNESTIVLAGRDGNSRSSLYVSVVNDSIWATNNGTMMVPVVLTDKNMTFDAVEGIWYYGFGNYRLLPRANDDFINPNITLDSLNCRPTVSVVQFDNDVFARIYPNPAHSSLNIETDRADAVALFDLNGRLIRQQSMINGSTVVDVESLQCGMYVLRLTENGQIIKTAKVLVQ